MVFLRTGVMNSRVFFRKKGGQQRSYKNEQKRQLLLARMQ